MLKHTPLYEQHLQHNGKMVDFAGWEMPVHYGSLINEHNAVRQNVGIFDVSHMGVLDVVGKDVKSFLRYVLANDVQKIVPGQALYTCMLNEKGGVVDDLIVYQLAVDHYRIVLNAANRHSDQDWLSKFICNFDVQLIPSPEFAILAVQGPRACDLIAKEMGKQWADVLDVLQPFHCKVQDDIQVARTGYTGEDGVEIILPSDKAVTYWQRFISAGATPCGLGARDTLRLEAGLNLYGSDMDETTSPLISNLAWTVSWQDESRDFVGKTALNAQKQRGVSKQLIGLVMQENGVLRAHQTVCVDEEKVGEITSGTFSPTLRHSIALARVNTDIMENLTVEIRGKQMPVIVVKPPFVRKGKKVYKPLETVNK